jgi:hypothetical protein
MNDLLEAMEIEVRIAAVDSVLMHQDLAMQRDSSEVVQLREERMMRALVDELIDLRGRQIDMTLSGDALRRA